MAFKPNFISLSERVFNISASVVLLIYGAYGIYKNDLYIPGKRSSGVHLQDDPAIVMYAAFICACLVMLAEVIDHYDRRNNERKYKSFTKSFKYIGWTLFGTALVLHIFMGRKA